jgi:imidazolonepropionase-like amidohydrolase
MIALFVAVALVGPVSAQPQAPIAIVHARAWDGRTDPVDDTTIVISGDRIVSVAVGGAPPAGATIIDAEGGVVTPGFIAPESPIGLVEISLEARARDEAPEGDGADPVRAAFSAADGYNPRSSLIPVARRYGVTNAISTPTGGFVSGTSALVDLDGATPDQAVVSREIAVHVDLDAAGVGAAGGAMPMAITRLREILDDARLYRARRADYDRRGLREMPVSRLDLERLSRVLEGRLPLVIKVARAADILRAIDIAAEYRIRLVLSGVEEGWRIADRIARANVPVIVRPTLNLPSTFSSLGARFDNAALLARAGVTVLFMTEDAHTLRNMRQEAGNAIAEGLDRNLAIAGLTSAAARVFGVDRDYGTLEARKVANLVVWNGDPFDLRTHPTHVIVRGRDVPLETRQTALFRRYRDLDRIRRGR